MEKVIAYLKELAAETEQKIIRLESDIDEQDRLIQRDRDRLAERTRFLSELRDALTSLDITE